MNSAKQSIFHVKKKLRSHQKQPAQHGRLHSTVLTKLIDQLFRHNVLYLSSLLSSSWFTSPVGHRHHSWDLMRFWEIMMWLVLELGRSGFIVHLRSMSIKMLVIRIFFYLDIYFIALYGCIYSVEITGWNSDARI